ncbi:Glycerol kinase [Rosistilla carotiformis]|uniref:Glycerol kinase n=1 Tax=Rosistilla carotiformis TaxID=2528017 RepID=A0A518JXU2_9BACT|nr:glycerol kinase GlpK [Rosistilla carotiformis]QDV70353.1 Glycerol kinase [Rosistilla carotiformis]
MKKTKFILALDQGTTSSRAILFDHSGQIRGVAQQEFRQILPQPGHVEHDPEEIWSSQLAVARQVIEEAKLTHDDIAAIGITNQRETVVVWDRETGKPIQNAIVWQSRITADLCDQLTRDGMADTFRNKTGLLIDPYFSGTKIKYILDRHPGLRARAQRGEVLFGTVDSFLLWRLTGGKHVTDYSNASRTLLYNIHDLDWDDELLTALDIPRAMLPEVLPSSGSFGETKPEFLGGVIPIAGVAGDQQAATFGQGCFEEGSAKNTYGTGCFMLMNIGETPKLSDNRLLTTIGWGIDGKVTYCLEGSVFVAGAIVQWLRDGLGIIAESRDVESLASKVDDADDVIVVPALVGLGAPHWDPHARGAILGISRGTTAAHIARASIESMAFQTRDVLDAMQQDAGTKLKILKVDGGACCNDALMQFQADILDTAVQRPKVSETTALGAAYLAGLAVGYWKNLKAVKENWALDREFTPAMDPEIRESRYHKWQMAVERSKGWANS